MEFFRSFGRDWFEFGKGGKTFHLGEDSLSGNEKNCLFRNDGGRFTEVGWATGTASQMDGRGFVAADFDRDGDLDFVVVNDDQPLQYFENRHPSPGHWLTVQLRGEGKNRFAVGARITLLAGGKQQVREIHLGSGYLSSSPPEAHFGLGAIETVERIEVRWPGTSRRQVLEGVKVDQVLVIAQAASIQDSSVPAVTPGNHGAR